MKIKLFLILICFFYLSNGVSKENEKIKYFPTHEDNLKSWDEWNNRMDARWKKQLERFQKEWDETRDKRPMEEILAERDRERAERFARGRMKWRKEVAEPFYEELRRGHNNFTNRMINRLTKGITLAKRVFTLFGINFDAKTPHEITNSKTTPSPTHSLAADDVFGAANEFQNEMSVKVKSLTREQNKLTYNLNASVSHLLRIVRPGVNSNKINR